MTIASPDGSSNGTKNAADRLLGLVEVGDDVFVTTIPGRGYNRLFGGQVAAQALLAACRTIDDGRPPHSLHSYFILGGKPDVPISYEVDRTRDGRSFSTRHVRAKQNDAVVYELLASFQHPETGPDWQDPASVGEVPPPPGAPPHPSLAYVARHLDIRRVDGRTDDTWNIHPFWVRATPDIGDDPAINAAMLTYVSDIALMANTRAPGIDGPMSAAASIDHAVWFHRLPRLDEWMLFSSHPVANIGARGMAMGTFHTADGRLVASVAQESLLRLVDPPL